MAVVSHKPKPSVDTDTPLVKSWCSITTKSGDLSFNEKRSPLAISHSKFYEKLKKDFAVLTNPIATSESKYRLESHHDHHDGYITENTDRRFHSPKDSPLKKIPMPYTQYPREKKAFYTPFKWVFNQSLAQHVNTCSLYALREVYPTGDSPRANGERVYQIQPDEEKVGHLREALEFAFELYYKLTMYHKIDVNFSVQANKLKNYLNEISSKIAIEREYIYDANSEDLFVINNIEEKLYKDQEKLRPIVTDKMIPMLIKLKKEFFAMEYLAGEHERLQESLCLLLQDINRTIMVIETIKKNSEKQNKLATLGIHEAAKLEKIKSPKDLHQSFIESAVQIGTLHSEANRFAKLRTSFKSYLKALIISEVYSPHENKLRESKEKLTAMKSQLEKRVESLIEDGLIRRSRTSVTEEDHPIKEFGIDFNNLVEGEQCLEQSMLGEMQDHAERIQEFVRLSERFCEEIKLKKNQNKVQKMFSDAKIYLEQLEKVLKGINLVKETIRRVKPVVEEEYNEDTHEVIEKKIMEEFSELTKAVMEGNRSMEDESWTAAKVKSALDRMLEHELESKNIKKVEKKSIAFPKRRMMEKLAKIIRRRTNEKNKLYVTCQKRVESHIKVQDILLFLQSKRLWQAVASKKSSLVLIQGKTHTDERMVNHHIYCNPDLELKLLKMVKGFVFCLTDVRPEATPLNFLWY